MADWTGWLREQLKALDAQVPEGDGLARTAGLISARTTLQSVLESINGQRGPTVFGAFLSAEAATELQRTVGGELEARLQRIDAEVLATLLALAGAPPVPTAPAPQPKRSFWQRLFGSGIAAPAGTSAAVSSLAPDAGVLAKLSPTLSPSSWLSLLEDHAALRDAFAAAPPPGSRAVIETALEKRNPETMLPLVRALGKLAQPEAEQTLRGILWATKDPETKWAAISALVRGNRNRAAEFSNGTVEERLAAVEGLAGNVEVCTWLNDSSSMVTQQARLQVAGLEPRLAVFGLTRVLAQGSEAGQAHALEAMVPLIALHAAGLVEALIACATAGGPLSARADELLAQCLEAPSFTRANLQTLKRAQLKKGSRTRLALEARDKPHASLAVPQLDVALDDAPPSDPAWLIYADSLVAAGDRCGEAIISASQGTPPRQFLEANADALLGRVPAILGEGKLGVLLDGLRYRAGLIDGAHLRLPYGLAEDVTMENLLDAFLEAPATKLLRELEVGLVTFTGDENEYGEVVELLSRSPRGKHLRALHLGAFDYPDELEMSWAPWGDVAGAWAGLPSLRSFRLRGARGIIGSNIVAPALERLTIETGGLERDTLNSVIGMTAPKLQHLELWFGDENYGAQCDLADVEPLLEKLPPTVTSLGLCNAEFTHLLLPVLARSKVLPRLKRLDLSRGVLNDSDVDTLLEHAAAFAHLEELDLERNLLAEAQPLVMKALPRAKVGEQRDGYDEGGRYVAVGE